jgi:hypothetical protein
MANELEKTNVSETTSSTFSLLKEMAKDNPALLQRVQDSENRCIQRRKEIRHSPRRGSQQTRTPSRLADLDGSRRQGEKIQMFPAGKVPKRRFNVGDAFEYDRTTWTIMYMYRLKSEPNVWYHCLEESVSQREVPSIGMSMLDAFEGLGAGATTPRIVYEMFQSYGDARQYFSDIYRAGSSTVKTTQQLLAMKKL